MSPVTLLTVDEAMDLLGSAALAVAECAPRDRLRNLLSGHGALGDLGADARRAARAYRSALRRVRAAGLAWIVEEQIEGAVSYAGIPGVGGTRAA